MDDTVMDLTGEEREVYGTLSMACLDDSFDNGRSSKNSGGDHFKKTLFKHWDSTKANPYHSAIALILRSPTFKEGKLKSFTGKGDFFFDEIVINT